jgi:PAS domain S-box-containing protein
MNLKSTSAETKIKALEEENALLREELNSLKSEVSEHPEPYRNSYPQLYDHLVDEVHIWKIIRDDHGSITNWVLKDVNNSALENWDKKKSEVIGKTPNEIFGSDVQSEFFPIVQKIFSTGRPERWEKYFKQTGQYLSMDSIPLKEHFISTGRDINEQKKLQKSLELNRKKLSRIFNATNEAIIIYDIHKNEVIDCNDATVKMYGYESKKDILKKRVKDLSALVEGFDQKEIEVHSSKAHEDDEYLFEWIAKKKNGEHFWVEVSLKRTYIDDSDIHLAVVRDISDKKEAEFELKKNQKKLDEIFNATSEGIAIYDIDQNKIVDCNVAMVKMYGFESKEDLLFREAIELSAVNQGFDAKAIAEQGKNAMNKNVHSFEWLAKRKNGSTFWVEVNLKRAAIVDENRHLVVVRDIDKKKQAELKLKNSEKNLREIYNATSESIAIHDTETMKLIDCNEATLKLYGYESKEDMLSLEVGAVSAIEDGFNTKKLTSELKKALEKENHTFEWLSKKRTGEKFWVEVNLKLVLLNNQKRLLAVARDISVRKEAEKALKESEEKFRSLAENTADALLIYDKNYIVTYVSPAYTKLFGYTTKEKVGNNREKIAALIHPKDRQRTLNHIFKAINNQQETLTYQFRFKHKNGNYIWLRNRAKFLYDESGNYNGAYIVCSDINNLKEAEEQLKQSNSTKDRFFSIIGHDLKGPFNNIIGYTNMLSNDFDTFSKEELKSIFKRLNSSTKNSMLLLDNLLDWYRTEKSRIHFNPDFIKINDCINEVVNLFKPISDHKNISLKYKNNNVESVFADINMMNSIMRNLISNAIKYTNNKGQVEIETQQNKDHVKISVKDNGIGMDNNTLNKLLEFSMTTSLRGTAEEKGTGLGLLICKEFVESHGGQLSIDSDVGKGSTFSFTLPVKK